MNVMRRNVLTAAVVILAMGLVACGDGGATDEGGATAFEGETMTFIVPYGEGGTFDAIFRAMARPIEDELGVRVVVENRTGAGGILAMNHLATQAGDGLTVGLFSTSGVVAPVVAEAEGVRFDLGEIPVVAQAGSFRRLLAGNPDSQYQSVDDVLAIPGFRYGTTGPGGPDHLDAVVFCRVLDLDCDIIPGFSGAPESGLALIAGDIDGASAQFEDRYGSIQDGDQIPLMVLGDERDDRLPDTPHLLEMDLSEDVQEIAAAHSALHPLGRMIFTSPGVDDDTLEALRDAFANVIDSEAFQTEMEAIGQDVELVPGDEAQQRLLDSITDVPPAFVEVLEEAL